MLGLIVSVVIYPVLHEIGHIIFAEIFGIKIEEINLFSEFSILCSVNIADKDKVIFIGYGGILFPMIVSLAIKPKTFVLWYMTFFLKIINIFSIILSVFSLITFILSKPLTNDDISTILKIDNMSFSLTASLLVLCFIVTILSFLKDEPLKHFDNFYYAEE